MSEEMSQIQITSGWIRQGGDNPMAENKYQSEIVLRFEDIRTELLAMESPVDASAVYFAAAFLTLAAEVNYLRQDLEEKQ